MEEIKEERFSPNVQMGIIVAVVTLLYLFFGLSSTKVMPQVTFYILMFYGAVIGSIFVYGSDAGEKMHFTSKFIPMVNVIFYGVVIGLMLASIETWTSGNTVFIQQSTETTVGLIDADTYANIASALVFIGILSFCTANSEEALTRGFFNSIAENFSDEKTTRNISKYILNPLIFSLLHFFMWCSMKFIEMGVFVVFFLLMYHFTFAIVCQVSQDVTGSIYTPITIHTIYNTLKHAMAVGIIVVGVGI